MDDSSAGGISKSPNTTLKEQLRAISPLKDGTSRA
jgi:hypothetical protein